MAAISGKGGRKGRAGSVLLRIKGKNVEASVKNGWVQEGIKRAKEVKKEVQESS